MDLVTQRVLRMLESDTMGAPESRAKNLHEQDTLLTQTKDHPIGDVSGRFKAPAAGGGGLDRGAQENQAPPDAKPTVPNGMTEELLRGLPNATGRMARMRMKSEE